MSFRLLPTIAFFSLSLSLTFTLAAEPFSIDPATVQRFGKGYRYPQAGWIVVHIEGEPYERGYQHGRLLHEEIVSYITALAENQSSTAPEDGWRHVRLLIHSILARGYDKEFLEEMKGIADGAASLGASYGGRTLDLIDIIAVNSGIELDFLHGANSATGIGLEEKRFSPPVDSETKPKLPSRCSAFAVHGPATADGDLMLGHITMFSLLHVRHYNIWLDIKPTQGHRVVMQTSPGGIMSGMDYYLSDSGLIVAETTIGQTPFNIQGDSVCSRIRKATQYAESIDDVVKLLSKDNNGLYTNEWMIGDIKTNEIAMFELGTGKQKLWRSGKNEWFGPTPGFYWGCNNTKDIEVRLETLPTLAGKPGNPVFRPTDRDLKWLELFAQHRGKMREDFGKLAFTTPPLVKASSCDAKFTTRKLAKDLKSWAKFGPPVGRVWEPTRDEWKKYDSIGALVANDWTLLSVDPPPTGSETPVDLPSLLVKGAGKKKAHHEEADEDDEVEEEEDDLTSIADVSTLPARWRGTILPKEENDSWLSASFSAFERMVAFQTELERKNDGKLKAVDREQVELLHFALRARAELAAKRLGKTPALADLRTSVTASDSFDIAVARGVSLLTELRNRLPKFDDLMDEFGLAHAGKSTTTADFVEFVKKHGGDKIPDNFLSKEINRSDTIGSDATWSIDALMRDPESVLIVFGTRMDREANQESAERLAKHLVRRLGNFEAPVRADKDVSDRDLVGKHLFLVGRPVTQVLSDKFAAGWSAEFGNASFKFRGKRYAHEQSGLVLASSNPFDKNFSAVLIAGNSADATYLLPEKLAKMNWSAPAILFQAKKPARKMLLKPATEVGQQTAKR